MNRTLKVAFVFYFVFILEVSSFSVPPVHGAIVLFRLEQVVWGTSTSNPITVEPGDTNTPLTADVRNLSNETLKGVYGTLQLEPGDPFIDYVSGGYNATAAGVPLQADILNPTGEILPAGSFSFTFRLNIARSAMPRSYRYNLTVEYLVKVTNTTWLVGEPKTLVTTILLPNRAPTVDSFRPSTTTLSVNVGDSLAFTAKCSDPDNDILTYEWKLDAALVSNSSGYVYAPATEDVGSHTLVLTVSDGNLTSSQTWTITVTMVSILQVFVSNNNLTGGFGNSLNITVSNNLWKGTIMVSLTVPSPLIIYGNQSWVFKSVDSSKTISLYPIIYAPASAIETTCVGTLTVNYSDEHGQAYADSYNVGFIIQGYIKLVVYEFTVSPQPVSSGSEVTIAATVLNTGNLVASYANASIKSDSAFVLSRESKAYLGDIEKNSPVPFSVVANIKSGVQNGTYPLTITLTYQDDQYRQHIINVTANVVVSTSSKTQSSSDGMRDILWFLSNGGLAILVIAGAGVVLLILYTRRLAKIKQMHTKTLSESESPVVH